MRPAFASILFSAPLFLLSVAASAQEPIYVLCSASANASEESVILVETRVGSQRRFAGLERQTQGWTPADACYTGRLPAEIAAHVAEPESVQAVCAFVTGDDGAGTLVIVRGSERAAGGYTVERKRADPAAPHRDAGQRLLCTSI